MKKHPIFRMVAVLVTVTFLGTLIPIQPAHAQLLKTVPFQRFSNDFVFDQEMTISALSYGFRIGEISIPTRYHEKASSIQFIKGTKFILESFFVIFSLYLNRIGLINDKRFAP